jgi:hypothetical protein
MQVLAQGWLGMQLAHRPQDEFRDGAHAVPSCRLANQRTSCRVAPV